MIQIARLLRNELYRLSRRRFTFFSIVVLAAVPPLWAYLQYVLHQGDYRTGYRMPNTYLFFGYAAAAGLKLATFLAVIFASLSFAGEFDHGTIKNLLTRPVLRGHVYVSKCLVSLLLLFTLQALAVYVALLFGACFGELGPVWKSDAFLVARAPEDLTMHAWKAISVAFPAGIAAVFIALFVSNLMESSGFAVATALTVWIVLDLVGSQMRLPQGTMLFTVYPDYAFDTFTKLASGSSAPGWREDLGRLYFSVPVGTALCAALAAYPMFRFKDVHA